jgi:hypothetical protein
MEAETTQDSQSLLAELAQAREKLDGLVRNLHAIDGELEALAIERRQHSALADVCAAMEDLNRLGGAELFWGSAAIAGASTDCIRQARGRAALFQTRVGEIEERRRTLLDEITQEQTRAYVLEDDAFEAQEEEERRQQEWIIEREIEAARSHESIMPWTRGREEDQRFRKSLATALLISLLFALLIPFIDVPLEVLEEPTVAEREVSVIMEQELLPPPPPPEEIKPQPREPLVAKRPEETVPQPVAEPEKAEPDSKEVKAPEQGLLAFREKLAAVKEASVVAKLGAQARINNAEDNASSRPERAMLTTNAPGSSGGIQLAALSRNLGGAGEQGAIRAAALTRASSRIDAIGPASRPLSDGPGPSRTDEEIQIVFDRYKAALYRLYNKELRRDPTLKGQIVLRLTIEPNGNVSLCQLHSTDMNAPDLSAQIVDRVRGFNFGAKEVPAVTIVYPIDFLPAA